MLAPVLSGPARLCARLPVQSSERAGLALAPSPPGTEPVSDADGSLAYRGPSWPRARLEANRVNLVVIRHGQSEANAADGILLYGQSETPLTQKGRDQAAACAAVFYEQLGGDAWLRSCASDPSRLPVFLSSPLSRAMDSASIICDHLRDRAEALGLGSLPLTVVPDPRLKETHFGRFEKRDLSEVQSAHPDFIANWRPPEGMGTDFRHRFPGGESRADLMRRTNSLLNGIAQLYPGRTVVCMSHSECILGMRTVLGQSPVAEGKVRADTGAVANAKPYWLVGQAPRSAQEPKTECYPL